MRKRRTNNFNFLGNFDHFVPGVSGLLVLVLWFGVGALLGNVVNLLMMSVLGTDAGAEFGTMIAYPVMFIPPMMYASLKSRSMESFMKGYKTDNSNFSPLGGLACALLAVVGTLALSFVVEPLTELLPEMPESLQKMLESMTGGRFWVNFICVSVFAPFCEEWLCRGMVLRGLLNFKRKEGRGISPAWAIVISAAFFAFIHLNPWQAIPAFLLGCLFGYVYYKTGSLKLTMLMHFANNTFALILSHLPAFEEADTWKDVIPGTAYWLVFAALLLLAALVVLKFKKVPVLDRQGSCAEVKAMFDE